MQLARMRPWVIRGNASEIMSLAAQISPQASASAPGGGPKGVDSTNTTEEALAPAQRLAKELGCVVAVSGAVDLVVRPDCSVTRIHNGHALMPKITATGEARASYSKPEERPADASGFMQVVRSRR